MTWTAVADQTTTYADVADNVNGYVLADYLVNGYIATEPGWTVVASVSTVWA